MFAGEVTFQANPPRFSSRGKKLRDIFARSQNAVTRLTVNYRHQESDDGAASYMEYNAC
jgi:hypothetical protein